MNRIHLILAILLIAHMSSAQWVPQNSNTNMQLYDVFFIDSEVGWIAGNDGVILKTINGGEDWVAKDAGTSHSLFSLYFTDEYTGYVTASAYSGNSVLKTIDGGESWTSHSSGVNSGAFNSIFFIDDSTGFIVGGGYGPDEIILKTTDAGLNWTRHYSDTNGILTSVFFVNKDIGYATGYHPVEDDWCTLPIVIKTTDGGNTWNALNISSPLICPHLYSVYFVDENLGFVTGTCSTPAHSDGFVLKTTDGGITWSHQFPMDSVFSTGSNSVFFTDASTGYLAGNFQSSGRVYKTNDGGENWLIQEIPDSAEKCNSVFFLTSELGYVLGNSGTILKTDNGGGPFNTSEYTQNNNSLQLYPNPGRLYVNISFDLFSAQQINISLFDISGQLLRTVHQGNLSPGNHQYRLRCSDLSEGIYIIKMQSDTEINTKKLVIQ